VEERIGIACGACDTFAPMGASWCPGCGSSLWARGPSPADVDSPPLDGTTAETPAAAFVPPAEGDLTATPEATEPPMSITAASEVPDQAPASQAPASQPEEESVEQSRFYICRECSSPVPPGHKFCGACGTTVPDAALERKVEYFGSMQAPGKARLILIRGTDGADGLSYLLQGTEHVAGRTDAQTPFPNT